MNSRYERNANKNVFNITTYLKLFSSLFIGNWDKHKKKITRQGMKRAFELSWK
jgi:hypothetical protein